MSERRTRLREVVERLRGERVTERADGSVNFELEGLFGHGAIKPGSERVTGYLLIDFDFEINEAQRWVRSAAPPVSASLEVARSERTPILCMNFERPLDPDLISDLDPLRDDAMRFASAWFDDTEIEGPDSHELTFSVLGDPRALEPSNAWIVMADRAAWPSPDEVAEQDAQARVGIFENIWTSSKQTEPGDLLFAYYVAPDSSICFIARAASAAFFDSNIGVNADTDVNPKQWWIYTTPWVGVMPLPFAELKGILGGYLNLHGKSGVYVPAAAVEQLVDRLVPKSDSEDIRDLLPPIVGGGGLPNPGYPIPLEKWRALSSGALVSRAAQEAELGKPVPLESKVESYLVEPLLHLVVADTASACWQKSYFIGKKIADYAVLVDQTVTTVVEVKVRVREPSDGDWLNSKDFAQVHGYARAVDCRSVLIDSSRIYLIDRGATEPREILERRRVDDAQLALIRRHILGL